MGEPWEMVAKSNVLIWIKARSVFTGSLLATAAAPPGPPKSALKQDPPRSSTHCRTVRRSVCSGSNQGCQAASSHDHGVHVCNCNRDVRSLLQQGLTACSVPSEVLVSLASVPI